MLDFKPGRVKPKRRGGRRSQRASLPEVQQRTPRKTLTRNSVPSRKNSKGILTGQLPTLRGFAALAFVAVVSWLAVGAGVEVVGLWGTRLQTVSVWGNRTLSVGRVVALAGLHAGMAVSSVDPLAVSSRLVRAPRVKKADVRRYFPGGVTIVLDERVPYARVQPTPLETAVIDREGFVLEVLGPVGESEGASLPRIRFSGAVPRVGERLAHADLQKGLRLLKEIQGLPFAADGNFSIDVNDPFAVTLTLPGKGHRLVLPPHALRQALARYVRLAPFLSAPLAAGRTIDLRQGDGAWGGRVTLKR